MDRWGATEVSSVVCPMPKAHSYTDVKFAYDKVRKANPDLTPAAWRKAAAQELGIDYNTFLAIWKTKGKVPVGAPPKTLPSVKMDTKYPGDTPVPEDVGEILDKWVQLMGSSKITAKERAILKQAIEDYGQKPPAALYRGVNSKTVPKVGDDIDMPPASASKAEDAALPYAENGDGKPILYYIKNANKGLNVEERAAKTSGYAEEEWIISGQFKVVARELDDEGIWNVTLERSTIKLVPDSTPTQPAAAGPGPSMNLIVDELSDSAKQVNDDVVGLKKQWQQGLMTYDETLEGLAAVGNDLKIYKHIGEKIPTAVIKKFEDLLDEVKGGSNTATAASKVDSIKEAADDAVDSIQTKYGTLDNVLAKSAYNKVKAEMPGASPATLRKAAAEYLGVDYKDFLLAWKKKPITTSYKGVGPPKKKAAVKPPTASNLPGQAPPGVSASTQGKYVIKDLTSEDLQDELARLYGPGANKDYIAVKYNSSTGIYTVDVPKSLIQSPSAVDKIAEGLQHLGLFVKRYPGSSHRLDIKAASWKKTSPKVGDQYNVVRTASGHDVLDMHSANLWTNRWWNTLDHQAKDAWHFYTGSGYRALNARLRGKPPWRDFFTGDEQVLMSRGKQLSSSMRVIDQQFTVFRGSGAKLSEFKVGALWSDRGFTSTSINPGGGFGGNVRFTIICPPGTRGMYIGKKSSHPGENEFLLDKGTEFRVMSIDGNEVKLMVVPKKK